MRRTRWLTLTVLLLGVWTFIVFEVGGRVGFNEDFCIASNLNDVIAGILTIDALNVLAKGNVDDTRNSLESTLDVSISGVFANSRLSPRLHSFAPSFGGFENANSDALSHNLKRIADYRQSHPYEDPSAKRAVDWLLAQYGMLANAQH
jgi:hypothetical protein